MTDLEINRALALAIGWSHKDITHHHFPDRLEVWWVEGWESDWRVFDYKDWTVIGPIAERFDCFPLLIQKGKWEAPSRTKNCTSFTEADTPQKAIALAVIGSKK